ncbi:MAG: hypothetical protein JWM95_72 [Gemmatimonadetes bacterium]|nr:hypothetical protein [Gemmatimonadota bacterium]
MTDSNNTIGEGAFGGEPPHDAALGALVRGVVGPVPHDSVNWSALAGRIGVAVAAQRAPWWSYAARWERRALPMALAAGLAATFALWTSSGVAAVPPTAAAEAVTAVISGTPAEDAASSFAHAVTGTSDFTVGVPE